jgi:hypothetical protein
MLITHFHLAPILEMGGGIPLRPLYVLMAWTWTALLNYLYCARMKISDH